MCDVPFPKILVRIRKMGKKYRVFFFWKKIWFKWLIAFCLFHFWDRISNSVLGFCLSPSSECWNCRSPPPHEFITRWGSNPGLGTLGMHSTKGAMRLYVSANTGWTSVTLIRELFNMIQMCTFSLKEKWCSLLNNLLLDTSENQEHFVYPLWIRQETSFLNFMPIFKQRKWCKWHSNFFFFKLSLKKGAACSQHWEFLCGLIVLLENCSKAKMWLVLLLLKYQPVWILTAESVFSNKSLVSNSCMG